MRIVIATAVYYPQINGVAVFSHNLALGLAEPGARGDGDLPESDR